MQRADPVAVVRSDGIGVGGGRGSWTSGPVHKFGFNRDYGSSVMYEPGKILSLAAVAISVAHTG